MKLIVGLGNPGKEYANTRHNVGFMLIDNYVGNAAWIESKDSMMYKTEIRGNKVIFLKPLIYMNLSGKAVFHIASYYKIDLKDILIIHDDLDLPAGKYRIKFDSSSGGHNGINSIIECFHSSAFCRLKIGIGRNVKINTSNYVLGKLSSEEINILNDNRYKEIIDSFIDTTIEKTMNDFNSNEG